MEEMADIPYPNFRKSPHILVNYDWADIISGSGYVSFYLAQGRDEDDTAYYFLTTDSSIKSEDAEIDMLISGSSTHRTPEGTTKGFWFQRIYQQFLS